MKKKLSVGAILLMLASAGWIGFDRYVQYCAANPSDPACPPPTPPPSPTATPTPTCATITCPQEGDPASATKCVDTPSIGAICVDPVVPLPTPVPTPTPTPAPEPTPEPTPTPPPPGVCTIPLNGTPLLGAYFLYPRIVDFTPKIQNAARCALPEVGYPGRQACPVCDEACQQRGPCEEALMGGPAPTFSCDSIALQCFSEDGWKVRVAGIGTGTLTACYPNRAACVTLQMTCDARGCRP